MYRKMEKEEPRRGY